MYFDVEATGNKSTRDRDRTLKKILKLPGMLVSASGISIKIFLSSDPNELWNRLNIVTARKTGWKQF